MYQKNLVLSRIFFNYFHFFSLRTCWLPRVYGTTAPRFWRKALSIKDLRAYYDSLVFRLEVFGNANRARMALGVVNKLAVQGNVEPLGEIWVSEYSNHDTNLMDLLVKVKEKVKLFSACRKAFPSRELERFA
jgi:hypothetical protein